LEETGLQRQKWTDVPVQFLSLQFISSDQAATKQQVRQTQQPLQLTGILTMTSDQILAEIREANLSYLMLAQSLVRVDREQALFRLGINEDTATIIGNLTPAQMMKMSAGNSLLCRFRMDDDIVWNLITNHGKGAANDGMSRLHASILMAGRHQEAA
jgi:flagellar transcriptional activator FlhD